VSLGREMNPVPMSFTEATELSDDQLQDLLVKSSRTFALAIPELPSTMRREVTIAYLLFRIADTFEDAGAVWDQSRQLEALAEFEALLTDPAGNLAHCPAARWTRDPPTEHAGYLELLAATPGVVMSWLALRQGSRKCIGTHTIRTTALMARFVRQTDPSGVLRLGGMKDLRAYCYAVAGIVGEMLTDLFLLGSPELVDVGARLRQRAAAFGEGLQLVNILKDSAGDAVEGRNYVSRTIDRAAVFALARRDLEVATEYVLTVQQAGGPDGVVAFTALPVKLAWATLDRVEARGPGAKISRGAVLRLYTQVQQAIAAGRPVLVASPRQGRSH